jgi:hypothetical protein
MWMTPNQMYPRLTGGMATQVVAKESTGDTRRFVEEILFGGFALSPTTLSPPFHPFLSISGRKK